MTCGKVGLLCAGLNGLKVAIGADNKEFYRRVIFFERIFKMARFPKPEAEIVALAQAMVSGLTANAATYPAPPVLPATGR